MKTILTSLFAVAFAVSAQSAAINWTVSQIKSSSDSTLAGSSYLGLFFIVTDDVTMDSIESLLDDDKVADAVNLASYTANASAAGALSATKLGSYEAGTTVNAFTVILNAANADDATGYIVAGPLSRTAGSTGNMAFSFGSQASNTSYSTIGGSTPETPDVPEPATGALALAGVALLFKRRRA